MPIGRAMVKAGYSKETSLKPTLLTKTKGWQELMEKYLPDESLIKIHKEGLSATTKKPHLIDRDDKGRPIYDYIDEDDYAVRHRYLETAYKLKKRLSETNITNNDVKVLVLPSAVISKNKLEISNANMSDNAKPDRSISNTNT